MDNLNKMARSRHKQMVNLTKIRIKRQIQTKMAEHQLPAYPWQQKIRLLFRFIGIKKP